MNYDKERYAWNETIRDHFDGNVVYVEHKELDEDGNVIGYSVFPDAMATVNISKDGTLLPDNINSVYGAMAGSTFTYNPNEKTTGELESESEPTIKLENR